MIGSVTTTRGDDGPVPEFAMALTGLMQAARRTRGRVQRQLTDLSAAQLIALQAVDRVGEKGVVAVAADIGIAQPTATRTVRALVERGLVERATDPSDGRGSVLRLTDAGGTTLAAARGLFLDLLDGVWQDMTAAERDICVPLLHKLTALLDRLNSADGSTHGHG